MVGNYDRAVLKDIKLVKKHNTYVLDVTYEYENKYGVYELNIPCVYLPIMTDRLPTYKHSCYSVVFDPEVTIDLGFGELDVLKDHKSGMTHKITEVEKKTHKMTVAEIEAALGYKVEIVSK